MAKKKTRKAKKGLKRGKVKGKIRRCSVCRSTAHIKSSCPKNPKRRATKRIPARLRRCSACGRRGHDKRKHGPDRKSKKARRTRRNPGVMDSLSDMSLSYSYTKPKHNPCRACGCTCRDGAVDMTRDSAAGASRFLRSRLHRSRRRNPGWSFRKDRVIPHEQQFDGIYQKPAISRRNPGWSFNGNQITAHNPEEGDDEMWWDTSPEVPDIDCVSCGKPFPSVGWDECFCCRTGCQSPGCKSTKIASRRNPGPWDATFHEPLSKRLRRLCRSDLSPSEISSYLDVPESWVSATCSAKIRRNPWI